MRRRRCGVLAHPSSLPGPHAIGDFGTCCRDWLEWLSSAGASVWQVLPLGPTGFGDSPYSTLSSFAGNPLLIDLDPLFELGLASGAESSRPSSHGTDRIDFDAVGRAKHAVLRHTWKHLDRNSAVGRTVERFRHRPEQAIWLDDWALFAALKGSQEGRSWLDWPEDLRLRRPEALERARRELAGEIDYQIFVQSLFADQWERVRRRAGQLGVEILGDLPFYPALDSADVWAHQELFDLDAEGRPRVVAGVPPDAFSDSGQLWGNPIFHWRRMAASGYDWWVERLAAALRRFDRLRLDHFRGYAAYWAVPAGDTTAAGGRWLPGPGARPFRRAEQRLGELPLIAEDLGVITAAVRRLRRRLGYPGMRVLQFAFDDAESEHLPHRLPADAAVYTGTHDNAPSRSWFASLESDVSRRVLDYTGGRAETVHWDLLRSAMLSPAELAIAPLQDLLGLGAEARLNHPGIEGGQWSWRQAEPLGRRTAARLERLAALSGRLPPEVGGGSDGETPTPGGEPGA